ncbi:signal recognition particle-docking protein FtsY [Luteibacter aegosomatissinici]|uniref:signal recognition particle-docking protein FtsY n=1 Tax=Luteibacter aegosomatissinici TaxID=2911539 RepID=UPI001FF9E84D|nr:signal recognition particle-docking protein FtsY [Luteibacter aegosomatissinici]UPG93519.1 signal recognition particle-docking protein FtsY [Luteibacter aegosomatissinici]
MLKFWKKKPAEPAATPEAPPLDERVEQAAVPVTFDSSPVTAEALAETAPPEPEAPELEAEAEATVVAAEAQAAQPVKRSWRERLSGSGFAKSLSSLFVRNPRLDDDLLDELETALITADVGVEASTTLVEDLRKRMHKREFADASALLKALREQLVTLLKPVEQPLDVSTHTPFVVLTVGINGVGKTTTIGKLARRFSDEGRSVMLAAGDTFRAAAVEQLKTWGDRNQVPVVSQGQDADAASVIFDALQAARSRGTRVLIADTAGRLHTQGGLMDELGKIGRVMKKLDPGAPHEVLMVIDGTTGQNAISQVRQFRDTAGVTGLVVTKLDGTAKGGVMFALAREFGLPIRYVGLGETATDLRVFDAEAFVDGLLPASLGG